MGSTLAAQQKASSSAYDCAATRALLHAMTRSPLTDYLANELVRHGSRSASPLARWSAYLIKFRLFRLARWLVARTSPGLDVYLFTRHVIPDELIREALAADATTQVVILGAGLDTSGIRIGAERRASMAPPGSFFEVDLPATQQEKCRVVTLMLRDQPNLSEAHITYVPCSFGEHELRKVLLEAGFDTGRPTIWVWTGVVHYLSELAVQATIADLRFLSAGGSKLFFDFVLKEAYAEPDQYAFRNIKKRFDSVGEVMSFGIPQGVEQLSHWLAGQGLEYVDSFTSARMAEYYQEKTGLRLSGSGPPWVNFCVARFS